MARSIGTSQLRIAAALEELRARGEEARAEHMADEALIGDGASVAKKLRDYGRSLGVEEIAILPQAHDMADRKASYGLIAEAMALRPLIAA